MKLACIAFYPVEELFELLHEQLHSAGLHGSAERAIEELQENVHCYNGIQLYYLGLTLGD